MEKVVDIGHPGKNLLVRVLGEPSIPEDHAIGGRPLQVLVYLASRDTPATTGHLMHAVWGGKAMAAATVKRAVWLTRCQLRRLKKDSAGITTFRRGIGYVRDTYGIVTDYALLRSCYEAAAVSTHTDEAIALLTRGLSYVHGPPFDAPGYDWAFHTGMDTTGAPLLIQRAAAALVDLALNHGHIDLARDAVICGLRGTPGDETLQRMRMETERQAGNTAGIHTVYREVLAFCRSIEASPDQETTELYEKLLGRM